MKPVRQTQIVTRTSQRLVPIIQYKSYLKEELRKGNTKKVLDSLYQVVPQNSDLHNLVLFISNQFSDNEKNKLLGIGHDISHNRGLVTQLISLIDTLDNYLPHNIQFEYTERIEVPIQSAAPKNSTTGSLLISALVIIALYFLWMFFFASGSNIKNQSLSNSLVPEGIRKKPKSEYSDIENQKLNDIANRPYYIVIKSFNQYDTALKFSKNNKNWNIDLFYTIPKNSKTPIYRAAILGFTTEYSADKHLLKVRRKWRKAWRTNFDEDCDYIGYNQNYNFYTCLYEK